MLTPVDLLKSDFHCSIMLRGNVAPAPVTVTSLWVAACAAGLARSSRPTSVPAALKRPFTCSPFRLSLGLENCSPEPTVDVVLGPGVVGGVEQFAGGPELDDPARVALVGEEEGRVVGHPGRLLHVVGDDDDRDLGADLPDRLLDALGGGRVERRAGLVHEQDPG